MASSGMVGVGTGSGVAVAGVGGSVSGPSCSTDVVCVLALGAVLACVVGAGGRSVGGGGWVGGVVRWRLCLWCLRCVW